MPPPFAAAVAPPARRLVRAVLLALAPLAAGCAGYQIGPRALYRSDVRTVHVPVFESDSFRRGLGQWLTEAVVKEIEASSPYKVVSAERADSVLTGRIVSERKRLLAENSLDDARRLDVELAVEVSWTDQRGAYLAPPLAIPLPPLAMTAVRSASFAPEAGQSLTTAQQEAIEQLAREIVQHMEMRW